MERPIAEVEEHELRSIWKHEERDFTVWLAENTDLLGAELGMEIEDATAEESVGDFSADIVAREMNTGETIVIENQYHATNHDHLGKLLTYSAGKGAGFTIWLAEEFRPEHRSVLEWLNESGPKDVKFFAIRPRVVSIAGSDTRGFEFDIVVEPNDWERELTTEDLSETEQAYQRFFGDLVTAYADRRPSWCELTPGTRGYMTFSAGLSGVKLGWVFHQEPEFSVELYISTGEQDRNEEIFETLQSSQDEIESTLGTDLVWERMPDNQACRIKWPTPIDGRITELSDSEKAALIEWGVDAMDAFQAEFEPRIAEL